MLENFPISSKHEAQTIAPVILTPLPVYFAIFINKYFQLTTSLMHIPVLLAGLWAFAMIFYHNRVGNPLWQRKGWKFRNSVPEIFFGILFTILFLVTVILTASSLFVTWIEPRQYDSNAANFLTTMLGCMFIFSFVSAKYLGHLFRRIYQI